MQYVFFEDGNSLVGGGGNGERWIFCSRGQVGIK